VAIVGNDIRRGRLGRWATVPVAGIGRLAWPETGTLVHAHHRDTHQGRATSHELIGAISREPSPELVPLDREYGGTTSALRSARSDVVDVLGTHVSDQDLLDRAELVVSELATNAIQAVVNCDSTTEGVRSLD
jgi:hypothetical protein